MENKISNFNDDLSISLSDVRACLDHWGLKDWKEYLVVRCPGKEDSYIVMANPADKSDFADRLVELHKQVAKEASLNREQ